MIRKAKAIPEKGTEEDWISVFKAAEITGLHFNTIKNNKHKMGWRRRPGKGGSLAPIEVSQQGLLAWIKACEEAYG